MNTDKHSQDLDINTMNSDDSNQSGKNNSTRVFIYALSLLLILALPFLVYKMGQDWRTLKTLQAELSTVKKQSNDLTILKQRIELYKDYHNQLKQLMVKTEQSEFGEKFWIQRKVEINKRQINRTEAAGFLEGVGRDDRSFFRTTMFDIHTTQLGDDLFKFRQGDSSEVQMTMDGVFYTKIKQ
ncbi:MAG: hypothetical protein L3J52_07320 [Proteobacteria bacterium]|nr:hypothetical protein [Pseudomonadota bacterium]